MKVFGRDLDSAIAAEARVVEEQQHFWDDVVPGDNERAAVSGKICSQRAVRPTEPRAAVKRTGGCRRLILLYKPRM